MTYQIKSLKKGKWEVYPKEFESFEEAFLVVEGAKDQAHVEGCELPPTMIVPKDS